MLWRCSSNLSFRGHARIVSECTETWQRFNANFKKCKCLERKKSRYNEACVGPFRSWVWWWSERCWTWSSPSTTWPGWTTSCLRKRRRRRMTIRRRARRRRRGGPNQTTARKRWETRASAAPCWSHGSLHKFLMTRACVCCVCVLQGKAHAYSNHSPSSESDLDRRYCVLKLHIPYKDLVYPDVVQSQWGAYCQAAPTHTAP